MQKLPVYLYSNLLPVQLDLDAEVKGITNIMYQRELKLQRGVKNKVQLQFKNSDQKNIRINALTTVVGTVSTSSSIIEVSDASKIQLGMFVNSNSVQEGTYISAISGNELTLNNLNPLYEPYSDQFLSPIITTISSGTSISFNHNFVFSMFDAEQQRMIVQKTLEIVDDGVTTATRGLALLNLTETDTRDLHNGYYNFSVTLTDNDGANLPAYSNVYYGMNGTARITHDALPTLKDSQSITNFQKFANGNTNLYEFYTGNLKAYPELTQTTTVAMYFDNYTGTINVQGTLENTPSTFANYSNIETRTYEAFTGVDYVNIIGTWSDVRVKWYPDGSTLYGLHNYYSPQMPGNPTPGSDYWPNGKIDKVLCRS